MLQTDDMRGTDKRNHGESVIRLQVDNGVMGPSPLQSPCATPRTPIQA
jgi:hypothetical protein